MKFSIYFLDACERHQNFHLISKQSEKCSPADNYKCCILSAVAWKIHYPLQLMIFRSFSRSSNHALPADFYELFIGYHCTK